MAYSHAAYSNLAVVPSALPKRSAAERRHEASAARSEETRLKEKIERANTILDRLEARAAAQAAALKDLTKRKAATLAKIERLEDEILTRMEEAGLAQLTGIRCQMRSQPAPAALEIVDESLIPRQYFNAPKTPPATPDKVAIKKALAADDALDPKTWGCKLTSKVSLIRR